MNNQPRIIEETGSFAVVFKPPKMHSAPHGAASHDASRSVAPQGAAPKGASPLNFKTSSNETLFEWFTARAQTPENVYLMHRLDFETHGLVLFAKNKKSYEFFKVLQENGDFIKEYSAKIVRNTHDELPSGFPQSPVSQNMAANTQVIESYFRPYGPGRKQVRPVIDDGKKYREVASDRGAMYRTEIVKTNNDIFAVQIIRGFRHQIRCHLCWIGCPILNDPLYSFQSNNEDVTAPDGLALRAHALFFVDPDGRFRNYSIEPL